MVGRSVENEIEIRAAIKTRALLSIGSTDIYADICTVYVSNSMSFSTVCRQVRDFNAGVVLQNIVDLNLQVVQRLL